MAMSRHFRHLCGMFEVERLNVQTNTSEAHRIPKSLWFLKMQKKKNRSNLIICSLFVMLQSTDLVSMVYSCIGAEIEDSDSSSTCDFKPSDQDVDQSIAISDAPADTRTNGHVASSKQQTERQMDTGRQERIVPLTDLQTEMDKDRQSSGGIAFVTPSGPRPELPPQCTKPSLSVMRQRHLQESLGNAWTVSGFISCLHMNNKNLCYFIRGAVAQW